MTDLDRFVAECRLALTESQPVLAIKELVARLVAEPGKVEAAVQPEPGVEVLHRSDDLTIASVVVPGGLATSLPHDHRMWAVVGVYGGQEDNSFFRRIKGGLEASGGRSLLASDTLAMGDDTVHAVQNPSQHGSLAAIHVYGGDLIGAARSMWTVPGLEEQPYDDRHVLRGGRIRSRE